MSGKKMKNIKDQIKEDIQNNRIILYMKGSKIMPLCGFSSRVVEILNQFDLRYETRDVLQNDELRKQIKDYSGWPTLPQLFIDGEFIGGCDIITQMQKDGQLEKKLKLEIS